MKTLQQSTIWLIDGPTLALYAAAATMVFLLREANERICSASSKEAPMSPALVALLALVSNLLCVATLVLLANALSSSTRMSMLLLPLLLLVERYGAAVRREPRGWRAPAAGLAGSAAGLASGAWLFLRKAAATEAFSRLEVPADAPTLPLSDLMSHEGSWNVSLKMGGCYLASIAIFFAVHAMLKASSLKLLDCPAEKRGTRSALLSLLAFALNFLGVVTLVMMAKSSDVQARLAMVGFPLFLIVESYTKLLRAEPQNRPAHWIGLVGSSGGMLLAAFFLLRGAPLH